MTPRNKKIKLISSLFSVSAHIIAGALLLYFYSLRSGHEDLIQIGFGEPGGGSGGYGPIPSNIDLMAPAPKVDNQEEKIAEKEKKPDVPQTENNDPDAEKIYSKTAKKTKPAAESIKSRDVKTGGNNKDGKGIGNGTGTGSGNGNGNGDGFGNGVGKGIDINWGGRIRKIYSYRLPEYPSGVSKEIDVKLRFTILPDGSVGRITVLQKADTQLEQVASEALRLWRFEPLPQNAEQTTQSAVITFPFRLK